MDSPALLQPDFDGELRDAMAQLRGSLADVLSAVGANVRVPHSITRQFGVDKSLASKLARVIREADPYAAVLDVPGEEAMRIFSRSMRDAGAPPKSLESLREAVDLFQQVVRTHCGDRATLGMIAGAAAQHPQKQQQQQEGFRRLLFRGSSAVFGVQARVHVSSHYIAPNADDPRRLDLAIASGLMDLRRIRPDVAWAISSMRALADDGTPLPVGLYEPIDVEARRDGEAPLLRDFCSSPVPTLRTTPGPNSSLRFELPEGPVGSAHSVTLFTGWIHRGQVSRYRSEKDRFGEHFVTLSTPAELVIHDLFVHKDLAFARTPGVFLYGQLPGAFTYPNGPRDRGLLPLPEGIQDLSGSPPRPATSEIPSYVQLTELVMERLGHKPQDFSGVRIQVRFPPIPSLLLYRYELPERA
jgi:hypothetical protein